MAGILSKLSKWDRLVAKSRIKARRTGKFFSRKSKAGWAAMSRHVKENRNLYLGIGASVASAITAGLLVRALTDSENSALAAGASIAGKDSAQMNLSPNASAVEIASARRQDFISGVDNLDAKLVRLRASLRTGGSDARKDLMGVIIAYHSLLVLVPDDDDQDFALTVDGITSSLHRSGLTFEESSDNDALLRSMIEAADDDTPLLSRKKDLETVLYADSLKIPMRSY